MNYQITDSNNKLFAAVTKKSQKVSAGSAMSDDLVEMKIEPDKFLYSSVSGQIEGAPDSSDSENSQNVDNHGLPITISFCFL